MTKPPAPGPGAGGFTICQGTAMLWAILLHLPTVVRALAHGPVTFWHGTPVIETVFRQLS